VNRAGLLIAIVGALQAQNVPVYKVDASWPKLPLPNKWMMQGVPTMVVDKDDHIWVISRPRDITPDESGASKTPPRNDCCISHVPGSRQEMQSLTRRMWEHLQPDVFSRRRGEIHPSRRRQQQQGLDS